MAYRNQKNKTQSTRKIDTIFAKKGNEIVEKIFKPKYLIKCLKHVTSEVPF
jgi:hypothetical protein